MPGEHSLFCKRYSICQFCYSPTNGSALCETCADKNNARNRKHYHDNIESMRESQNVRHRRIYQERKAQNLCTRCGQKNNTGYSKCQKCRDSEAEYKRLRLQVS